MKKTIITLLALSGVAMATEYTGSFTWGDNMLAPSFAFSGDNSTALLLMPGSVIKLGTENSPEPVALGYVESKTYSEKLTPNMNMNAGGWSVTFSLVNMSGEAITLQSLTLDSFIMTSDGEAHVNDNKVRQVSFTLTGDITGSSTVTFTAQDIYNIDADAVINFDAPVEIASQNMVSYTLTVKNGGENQGSYVGLKGGTFSTEAVPEPTTATLSLLALAGLAARRRRR